MMDERICQHDKCQKIFMPTRHWQKYCSPECRSAVFYARKFENRDPLADLDFERGPSEVQEAEWASRKRPEEDKQQDNWKAKLLAEEAEKILQERDNPAPSAYDKYKPE